MKLKVLVLVLLSVLLAKTPTSQAEKLREEIVRKKVTVNLPKHITSHISHFNPAAHEYAAEGNVVIDRVHPEVEVYKPPEIKLPEPPKNLAKKVLVQSPATAFSQNRHFDPAPHEYEATGTVLINRDSPLLKAQQHIFQPRHHPSLKGKTPGLVLTKSVTVKSPQQKQSVISHFHPTPHIYAAVGDVVIDKTESVADGRINAAQIHKNKSNTYRKSPQPSPTTNLLLGSEKDKSSSNRISTFSPGPPPTKQASVGTVVRKSVSVQLPEHRISAIDHFNPAGHKYAATGDVEIDRETSVGLVDIKPVVRQPTKYEVNIARAISKAPLPVRPVHVTTPTKVTYERTQVKAPESPRLHLKKTVSVKSPPRASPSINHFDPAGHVYAASGGVAIDRSPSRPAVRAQTQVKHVSPPQPSTTYKQPERYLDDHDDDDDQSGKKTSFVLVQPLPTIKHVTSGLGVKKSVSVQLPEHRISSIDHFNPAGHKYAATGGVEIDREASLGLIDIKPVVRQPTIPEVNIVRTISRAPSPVRPVHVTTPTKVTYERTVKAPESPGLHLKKTVSVKSPPRVSSAVNHFDPAGHVYAASGGVAIDRSPSRQAIRAQTKIKHVSPSHPTTYKEPERDSHDDDDQSGKRTSFVSVQPLPTIKHVTSGLGVKKSVSVQLPEHRISAVDHFNPAGHKYAATGGVEIDREVTLGSIDIKPVVRHPTKPEVNIVRAISRAPSPVRPVHVTIPTKVTYERTRVKAPESPELHLKKTVSVESPPRASSSVNHFDPAGHVYAASGGVAIDRSPSRQAIRAQTKIKHVSPSHPTTYKEPERDSHDDDDQSGKRTSLVSVQPLPTIKHVTSGLGVKKSVSVQLPEHRISSVDHFNPAGHKYAATGGVEIDREVTLGSVDIKPVVRQPTKAEVNIVRTISRAPSPVRPVHVTTPTKVTYERTVIAPESPRLHLKKTVSVKSPPRTSSAVNHFDHAGHVYAASGGVAIDRSPSRPAVRAQTQVKHVSPPQPLTTYKQPERYLDDHDDDDDQGGKKTSFVSVQPLPTIKHVTSGLGVKKSVSVQLPEHRISSIDHFNPAGHKYAATGGVEIDREASLGLIDIKPVVRQPTIPEVNIVRTISRAPSPVRPVHVTTPTKVTYERTVKAPASGGVAIDRSPSRPAIRAQTKIKHVSPSQPATYKEPERDSHDDDDQSGKRTSFVSVQPLPTVKHVASGLGVKKSVSVQLPEHRISAVDHFNPAGHRYAATGGVEIDRGAFISSAGVKPTVKQPVTTVLRDPSPPKVIIPKISTKAVTQAPAPERHKPIVQTLKQPLFSISPFELTEPEITYHRPGPPSDVERDIGFDSFAISTKEPEESSDEKISFDFGLAPTYSFADRFSGIASYLPPVPNKEPVHPKPVSLKSVPVEASVAHLPHRESLHLKKKVTVHSPQHKSSIIAHFSPAVPVYEATGEVIIDKEG